MQKLRVLLLLTLLLATSLSNAYAFPRMVCDPSPEAVGGGYEIWEVTVAYPEGRLAYSEKNEADGSINMDLNEVPMGTHKWKLRYAVNGNYSPFVSCVLVVTQLYYKNLVKTYDYYSVSKSWVLKVPKQ